MLRSWDKLPARLQTNAVRPYYEVLQRHKLALVCKRLCDLLLAILLLVLLALPMLVIALLIKLEDRGPIFFRQERVTQYCRIFRIFKFRTMTVKQDAKASQVTTKNDNRITRIGHFLRKTRLDELPQLFNILTGDMSLVGTRPEVETFVNSYSPEMYATLLLPAGVTSLASIEYKDEARLLSEADDPHQTYVDKVLPAKMKINLEQLANFSFAQELSLLLKTVLAILR